MKDRVDRDSVMKAILKLDKDTNPDNYKAHDKFISYMDDPDIGSFGNWKFANGYNLGVIASKVEVEFADTAEPQWISCKERLPDDAREVWVTVQGHDLIVPHPGESIQDAVARTSRQRWVTRAYWCEGENSWNDPSFGVPLMVQPIAWMDIERPEPWEYDDPEDDFINKPEGEDG